MSKNESMVNRIVTYMGASFPFFSGLGAYWAKCFNSAYICENCENFSDLRLQSSTEASSHRVLPPPDGNMSSFNLLDEFYDKLLINQYV